RSPYLGVVRGLRPRPVPARQEAGRCERPSRRRAVRPRAGPRAHASGTRVMDEDLPRRLSVVRFRWRARFGFFCRAEAARAGYGYPVPPRTAVLGVIANVLGLPKDELAVELAGSHVAVSGVAPRTHWHNGNHRKDPPA